MNQITLDKLVEDLKLEIIYKATNMEEIKISASEVNRPGLQLAGYFDKFAYERLQIVGNVEWYYCNSLEESLRYERLKRIFLHPFPAMIISRELPVFPEMLKLTMEYNRSILRTDLPTTKFINVLINYLDYALAPETTVHGVLVEVYGMGLLIMGKSGVGKSETALELVKRGHRLVADDVVEIKNVEERLRGEAPDLIRHFMEIRGIGILDIERLYGFGAVKKSEFIDLIVELEFWDESKEYDRVGLDESYTEILGIQVATSTVPVRPGRNVAMIIEVAARNFRQKALGYNAAYELNERIKRHIEISRNKKRL